MAFFEHTGLWADGESVSAVTELDVFEAVRCGAIIDENIVGLDICRLIRYLRELALSGMLGHLPVWT